MMRSYVVTLILPKLLVVAAEACSHSHEEV